MENQNRLVTELLKLTESKPYFITGDSKDFEYYSLARENKSFFVVDSKNVIWSIKSLIDFWLQEITMIVEEMNTDRISLTECLKHGQNSFITMFRRPHPYMDMYYIEESDIYELADLHLLEQPLYELYLYRFMVDRIIPNIKIPYEFKETEGNHYEYYFIKGSINNDQVLIPLIKELLFVSPNNKLKMNELLYKINRRKLPSYIPKPIEIDTIIKMLNERKIEFSITYNVFSRDEENDNVTVNLNDYTKSVIDKTNWIKYSLLNEILEQKESVYLLKYIGTKVPFLEAVEYLKVRPIIQTGFVGDIKTYYSKQKQRFYFSYNSEINMLLSTLHDYLFDGSNNDSPKKRIPHDWIENNIMIGIAKIDEIGIHPSDFVSDFIMFNSPILNIDNNSTNPFLGIIKKRYVIKRSLESA